MKPRQQVSKAAIELIKTFEGYRPKAAQLADGRWTIGYGHTLTARQGAEVSSSDAEALLLYDLIAVAHAVNEHVYTPLTQNQFDGLTCFAFNIGVENFRRSMVLRRVNEGNLLQAAYAMEMWRRADFEGERIVIDALVRRRSAEKTLFLTPLGGWTPVPSPVLPPKIDFEIEPMAPREKPTAVRAPLDGPLAVAEREEGEAVPAETVAAPTEPELSAAEQAAAAVTARLETLLPEEVATEAAPSQPETIEPRVTEAELAAAAPVEDPPSEIIAPRIETEAASPALEIVADEPAVQAPAVEQPVAPPPTYFVVNSRQPTPPPATEPQPQPEPESPPPQAERWSAPTLAAPDAFTLSPEEEPLQAVPSTEREEQPTPPFGPSLFDIAPPPPVSQGAIIENFDREFALERIDSNFTGAPLVGLGLIGLVVFAGGVFWGLNAAPDQAGGMPVAKTVGWVLGVLGVICFGIAAYGLLRRLGGDEELED
jgi:lysozyme